MSNSVIHKWPHLPWATPTNAPFPTFDAQMVTHRYVMVKYIQILLNDFKPSSKFHVLFIQKSKFCFFFASLLSTCSRKHYPLAIVAFFCLLNGPAELAVVAALALGYLRRIQIDAVLPSDGKLQRHSGHVFGLFLWSMLLKNIQQAGTNIKNEYEQVVAILVGAFFPILGIPENWHMGLAQNWIRQN